MAFTNEQLERYSRHIILKEIGVKGQKKLLNAKVLIIGATGFRFRNLNRFFCLGSLMDYSHFSIPAQCRTRFLKQKSRYPLLFTQGKSIINRNMKRTHILDKGLYL